MDGKTNNTHANERRSVDHALDDHHHMPSLYSPLAEKDRRIIYLLLDDSDISNKLNNHIKKFGYETRFIGHEINSPDNFELNLRCALLCDLSQPSSNTVTLARNSDIPIIYLSHEDSIEKRLESVRTGGSYFLSYGSKASSIAAILDRATTPHLHKSYRILIVDDDEMLAKLNQISLKRAGMVTRLVHNPLDTLKYLDDFKPDLILMDIYMPQCSGTELARIIRQQEQYAGIPIVFLSSESDIQEQMAAMEFGGDDFLSKPAAPERLVASVANRAKRAVDANIVSKKLEALASELKAQTIKLDNALISARSSEALKTKLIATMSHEVRTPINGMIGILERLLDSSLKPSQKEQAEIVLSSTESLLRILNDTLDFSKIEAGKMVLENTDFNLRKCAKESQQLFHDAAIKKGIIIHYSIDEAIPKIMTGDPLRIKQVLINLTNNAIKFTDEGDIDISIKLQESHDDNLLLMFKVKDSGIGMTLGQQNKIFQEYSQAETSTSRTHGGTGLGLSICEKLVKMMGGEIGVTSQSGIGSTFWFTIELSKADIKSNPASSLSAQQAPVIRFDTPSPRLLVADDCNVNLMVISSRLKKLGITVDTVANGEEAIYMAQKNCYQMILMDCHMPVVDGYMATQAIRAYEQSHKKTGTPIIAITGNTLESDTMKCLDAGMDDHLPKPVRDKQLIDILKKWLEGKTHVE